MVCDSTTLWCPAVEGLSFWVTCLYCRRWDCRSKNGTWCYRNFILKTEYMCVGNVLFCFSYTLLFNLPFVLNKISTRFQTHWLPMHQCDHSLLIITMWRQVHTHGSVNSRPYITKFKKWCAKIGAWFIHLWYPFMGSNRHILNVNLFI